MVSILRERPRAAACPVRITVKQALSIRNAIEEAVPEAEPFLFGSRTDNSSRGGDIDILLLTDQKLPLSKLLRIRRIILQKIGDQKLDLVNFSRDSDSPFKKLILETAVRL